MLVLELVLELVLVLVLVLRSVRHQPARAGSLAVCKLLTWRRPNRRWPERELGNRPCLVVCERRKRVRTRGSRRSELHGWMRYGWTDSCGGQSM